MVRNYVISLVAALPLGFVWAIVKHEADLPGIANFALFALTIGSGGIVFVLLEERRRARLPERPRRR